MERREPECNSSPSFPRVHELGAAGGTDVLRRWVAQKGEGWLAQEGGAWMWAEGWVGPWPQALAWCSLQCLPPFSAFLHPLETTITSTTWMRVKVSVTSLMCLFSTSD